MLSTRIFVPQYIKEYLHSRFWDAERHCIRFSEHLDVYHVLFDLLAVRPADCPVDRGNVSIFLPVRSTGKNTNVYNYLSERAQGTLNKHLRTMFWADAHDFIDSNCHKHGYSYNQCVEMFMREYGIEGITEDAIIKNYYRWRKKTRKWSKTYNRCKQ